MMNEIPAAGDSYRLRALVVEDEWPARNYLVELIEASQLAEVVGAVASLAEARQALQLAAGGLEIDAVFVDIALGGSDDETGLDLVRTSVHHARRPMFVLATAFKEHAIEAFELGVDDYLLKPFTQERVDQCLRRLHVRKRPSPPSSPLRIVARRGKSLVFLEPNEAWAFEAADRLTSVHTPHGTFDLDLSLSSIEASFGRALTRVHRNWLVNAAYIKELEREGGETRIFVGLGIGPERRGVSVPVSRDRAQSVREMLLASATGLRRA
ncbi:LytR/AlgR family response regulator transcription factor [Polyangium jinanense]|uniref:Response regulator transcription factor n=2 Tax=Polyangium jinanense TaxID=2829994 RepID=A0A9X3XEW6_9BACT|nr:LytTR family DNA-binding domain-containing protein [Polyangium jinanense]MDC3960958.1 response regulator transcription factor [Polyangium jinanense]MDC3987378.1 response regulator transcription factor [Polyangium jinanense]